MAEFEASEAEKILEDNFTIYPKKQPHNVRLYRGAITFDRLRNGETSYTPSVLKMEDIIGCQCMSGRQVGDHSAYFCIYAYPWGKKVFGGDRRQRRVVVFRVSQFDTFEANLVIAERWRKGILMLLRGVDVSCEEDIDIKELPQAKKILFLINPYSGQGKADKIFKERVVPLLGESDLNYHPICTEYQGHAHEIAKGLEVNEWDALAIVSGDGLVYEVINGLMSREDRETAMKIPIGIIPGGSGNALISAMLYAKGEPLTNLVQHATFSLIKGQTHGMDLVRVQSTKQIIHSFLSTCWGIISDVDIESEKYRKLGDTRFTIQTFARIAKLRVYHGRLSFLRDEDYHAAKIHVNQQAQSQHINRTQSVADRSGMTHACTSTEDLDEMVFDENGVEPHMVRSQSEIAPSAMDRSMSYSEHFLKVTSQDKSPTSEVSDSEADESLATNDSTGEVTANGGVIQTDSNSEEEPLTNGKPDEHVTTEPVANHEPAAKQEAGDTNTEEKQSLLPPLDEPVPSDWKTVEGDFVNITAVYLSHLSTDVCAWPNRNFKEGVICIQYLKAPLSRKNLLSIFLDLEKGEHLKSPYVSVEYVKAFRIEPMCEGEIITVDGEKVDYGPIQGEILPNAARVMY
ncbi:sphingosine kinase 1-like [Ptychodera flava]|uniref:sphingosine kinase 1-like n=1 Tax=Ptychodera flava TaxID=63121 RepID=UPI00396A7D2A